MQSISNIPNINVNLKIFNPFNTFFYSQMIYLAWKNYAIKAREKLNKAMRNEGEYFESDEDEESQPNFRKSLDKYIEGQRNNTPEENYMTQGGQGMI